MATYSLAVSKNGVTMGYVHCEATIVSQDVINNTSTVRVTGLFQRTGTLTANSTFGLMIVATGYKTGTYAIGGSGAGTKTICTQDITLSHGADGSLSLYVSAYVTFGSVSFGGQTFSGTHEAAGVYSPPTIDRAAPYVVAGVANITDTQLTLRIDCDVYADAWQYSVDGGTTWIAFSSATAMSQSVTISGLTSSTAYTIIGRCRRQYNQVFGMSAAVSATTLGGLLWLRVDGSWRHCTAHIKVNGTWRRASSVLTKITGTWRRST